MPLHLSKSILFLHSPKPKSPIPMANLSSNSNLAAPNPSPIPKARLRGVLFYMDGTLTVPAIDFSAMDRALLGEDEYFRIKAENPSGIDILHQIQNWSPEKQRKAYETIAATGTRSAPDHARRGLIKRNVKAAVDLFEERFGITFSPALSREFRPF